MASHGLNRFPRFVRQIKAGVVRPDAEPVCAARFGPWEQWDGQLGPGNLNATAATDRAIALAKEHGLGLVALRNTNHWMRGGTYGWQAVGAGVAFIGWTNTTPNMPPWGTLTSKLGNTPVIIAIPRGDEPVVLDVAMSQFSYGKMETLQLRGEQLPMPGGYDEAGHLTTDPGGDPQDDASAAHRLLEGRGDVAGLRRARRGPVGRPDDSPDRPATRRVRAVAGVSRLST